MKDKPQNLLDQRRKIEEVRTWLQYRVGSECNFQVRNQMFEALRLLGFASITLEAVNHLTNNEYNDCETERGRAN